MNDSDDEMLILESKKFDKDLHNELDKPISASNDEDMLLLQVKII